MPEIWVNIGSGNGLLPDGTKPLPDPMLTSYYAILWHSLESNMKKSTEATIFYNESDNHSYHTFDINATSKLNH